MTFLRLEEEKGTRQLLWVNRGRSHTRSLRINASGSRNLSYLGKNPWSNKQTLRKTYGLTLDNINLVYLLGNQHLRKYICHQKMETCVLSIPVELLTRIFESCNDFSQVVALASVCKHTHMAWVLNPGTIIWSVARSEIRSFDDALMAVNYILQVTMQNFPAKEVHYRCEQPLSFSNPTTRGHSRHW